MRLCGGQLCLYLSNCQFSYLLAGPISASNFTLREVFFSMYVLFWRFYCGNKFYFNFNDDLRTHTLCIYLHWWCVLLFLVWLPSTTHPHFTFFYRDSDKRNWIRPRFWFLFFGLYPLIGIASVGVLQISDKNWADHFWNIMNTLNFTRRQTCWCKISPSNQR